jgi:hypothetical protein
MVGLPQTATKSTAGSAGLIAAQPNRVGAERRILHQAEPSCSAIIFIYSHACRPISEIEYAGLMHTLPFWAMSQLSVEMSASSITGRPESFDTPFGPLRTDGKTCVAAYRRVGVRGLPFDTPFRATQGER